MRPRKPKALRNLLRRFRKTNKGSTAIEFAFIILPFLMLTLGTLEIALIHLSRSSMSDAIEKTTRQIMTGQADCLTPEEYIEQLCGRISFANGDCEANTKVVMEKLDSFSDTISDDEQDWAAISNTMTNGRENDIMLLRVYHRWTVLFPLLDDALGGGEGNLVLVSNLAFKNEPYSAGDGCVPPPPPPPGG